MMKKLLNPRLSYINITLNDLLILLLNETMIFYFASKVYIKKLSTKELPCRQIGITHLKLLSCGGKNANDSLY